MEIGEPPGAVNRGYEHGTKGEACVTSACMGQEEMWEQPLSLTHTHSDRERESEREREREREREYVRASHLRLIRWRGKCRTP